MAGSGGGPTLTQLPGWRVGILFAMFWCAGRRAVAAGLRAAC